MERRTFLLGLIGGLAAATGLVITGTAPAEASPPQSRCGRSGKRRSKSGKARRRCHREYAVLSPAGASGLSPLLPATRQALLQARTPVLLLKRWSAGVSEWASSPVRKGRRSHQLRVWIRPSDIARHREWHYSWSEGACALPLQWSLPRPRKPRPSPEKARFLFRTCDGRRPGLGAGSGSQRRS